MQFPDTSHELDDYFKDVPARCYTHDSAAVCVMGTQGTYGEITVDGVRTLLQYAIKAAASPTALKTFVDLGSGIGKACIAAALQGPETLEKCFGIELSEERTSSAQSTLQSLKKIAPVDAQHKLSKVEFTAGDFFEYAVAWIARADVIWISNLCFPQEVNDRLSVLIDAFAPTGCLVFSSCAIPVERQATPEGTVVVIPQSWQTTHHARAYRIAGAPTRRIQLYMSPMCLSFSDACERAFAFWALFDGKCSLDIDKEGSRATDIWNTVAVLPANRVHSAVVDALFHLTDAVTLACHTPLAEATSKEPLNYSGFESLCHKVAVHLQLLRPAHFFWPFCC